MKKWLTAMLAGILLLTACGDGTHNESSADEDPGVDDGVIKYTLVSVGKPYMTSVASNETYPDRYGQQLTDGEKVPDIGAHYVDTRMVGFNSGCTFQIDLGDDGKRISAISARCLEMNQDGVGLAPSARFAVSKDGQKFVFLGNVTFESHGDLTVSTARYELAADKIDDYRYVRVVISVKSGSAFFFVDELEVFADVPEREAPAETVDLAYAAEDIDRNAWQALSTKIEALPVDSVNAALGATYKFKDCTFDERAPKDEKFLTDGERTNRMFSEAVWVGISGESKNASVTLDLAEANENIYNIRVHALGSGIDVAYPDYIDVYGAKADRKYVFLGRMYAPSPCSNYAYTLLLPEYIEVKHLRFDFPEGSSNYWIEEIEVYSGCNEETRKTLYPKLSLPVVTEELRWDSSESDYKKYQNLLLGRTQQVAAAYYAGMPARDNESPYDSPVLTDGKLASDTYCYNGQFFFARGEDAVDFFFDLEKLSSVDRLTVSMLEQGEWGIVGPKFVDVFLSENGTDWFKVDSFSRNGEEISKPLKRVFLDFKLDKAYAARFVRFRIESGAMFIDELEAFGTKEVKSSTKRLAESGLDSSIYYTNAETEQYATTENTPIKAGDIAIIYGNKNNMEKDMLLPFVAYLDEEGNIKDTFMDGFLYCNSGILPSGSQAHLENYKQDWEHLYNITFNGDVGMDKLEATVQTVKDALNIPDYKVQVYFTFLTIKDTVTDFGDVDGDGIGEDLSTPEGRKKVIDWYIDLNMNEFNSRNYKNLEVGGFYWINEAVTWDKDDSAIVKEVAGYVHAKDSCFLWVPYYKANRFFTGNELDFDLVCMQPNVVFTSNAPLWRFDSTAEMVKARKMCVEIEHTYQALSDPNFARSYMLYLYYGAVHGYMDAVHIYYDDFDNFAQMAYSDSALCRMQYDATYAFAKRDLDVTPDSRDAIKLSAQKDTILRGTLHSDGVLESYTLAKAPEHGSVSLGTDGSFIYYPEKGYTGSDSFAYTYNVYLGESEQCVVDITVG